MTTNKPGEPQEHWIYKEQGCEARVADSPSGLLNDHVEYITHVVEYAAYENKCAELAQAGVVNQALAKNNLAVWEKVDVAERLAEYLKNKVVHFSRDEEQADLRELLDQWYGQGDSDGI